MKKFCIAVLMTLSASSAVLAGDCALGTGLEWEPSIDEAARRARKEGRLVLALHVSGRFDQPQFT